MKRSERRRLERQIQSHLRRATAAVKADPGADIDGDLDQIEKYSRLISASRQVDHQERAVATAIGLLCVTLVAATQIIRMPSTSVTLAVDGTSATFSLAETWRWDNPAAGVEEIRLESFAELGLPPSLMLGPDSAEDSWIDFSGGQLTLATLSIAEGSRVTVETADGATDLFVLGGAVGGELTLAGELEIAAGSSAVLPEARRRSSRQALPLPEIVSFASEGEGIVPARLSIRGGADLSFEDVRVASLSFARETALEPGRSGFVSTIREGVLSISDTGRQVQLRRGDHLEIGGREGARLVHLTVEDQLQAVFEGRVDRLDIIQAGNRRDLRPTLLEYLYHNERLVFLWSALGLLWGLAWSLRRAIF